MIFIFLCIFLFFFSRLINKYLLEISEFLFIPIRNGDRFDAIGERCWAVDQLDCPINDRVFVGQIQ